VVRAFMPHAERVVLRLLGEQSAGYEMHRAHPQGLYQTQIPRPSKPSITNTSSKRRRERRTAARIRIASAPSVSPPRTSGCSCAASTSGCSKSSALGRPPAAVSRASSLPYGRRTRSASASSAPSTRGDGRRHPMQRVAACGV
jgi:hypothetical protein